jgi:multidrug efflux pump
LQEGMIAVFPPPPVRGIGSAGGFKIQIEDRSGRGTPQQLQEAVEKLIAEGGKRPEFAGLFSTFRASFPQLYGEVNRVKAKQERVAVTDVFQTLQVFLGGFYINDFNYLGRTWHVTAQADAPFRAHARTPSRASRRATPPAAWCRSAPSWNSRKSPARTASSATIFIPPPRSTATPRPATAAARASPRWKTREGISARQLLIRVDRPRATRNKLAGNTALYIFPLCVLFVWLVHSAEYESFALSTLDHPHRADVHAVRHRRRVAAATWTTTFSRRSASSCSPA